VKLLHAALEAGAEVESVFVGTDSDVSGSVAAALERAEAAGIRVHRLGPGVVEKVADTVTPQPVLAIVRTPVAGLEVLRGATFVVVCVDVRDPGNAGAVIRSADAAGADAVVCCAGTVDPFNPKTVRAAAGSVLHVPVLSGVDPDAAFDALGEAGLLRLAALSHGGTPYTDVDLTRPLALVLGNEAAGLPVAVEHRLDGTITIPLAGRAESLNVSMAAAVLCFAVREARAAPA